MSDTPRTDAEAVVFDPLVNGYICEQWKEGVDADFARTLERESSSSKTCWVCDGNMTERGGKTICVSCDAEYRRSQVTIADLNKKLEAALSCVEADRALRIGRDAALAERDHRIAELQTERARYRADAEMGFAKADTFDRARRDAVKDANGLQKELDTATRELAEAKAEIARLRDGLDHATTTIAGLSMTSDTGERREKWTNRRTAELHAILTPGNAAHETPVERPCQHCGNMQEELAKFQSALQGMRDFFGNPRKEEWSSVDRWKEAKDVDDTARILLAKSPHFKASAPMAYETFVLMKQALEAQCKATAFVTAERDQLKQEVNDWQGRWSAKDDDYSTTFIDLKETRKDRDRLTAENEKLRATVTAKDEALEIVESDYSHEWPDEDGADTRHRVDTLLQIRAALSPEIANEFVRREVLEELRISIREYQLIPQIEFHPRLLAAISRAETELAKGKQP